MPTNAATGRDSKARQLAGQQVPRVLAISLAQRGASVLLGRLAAEWLMMSEPKIEVPLALEGEAGPSRSVADLKNSAFLRFQDGQILPVRKSISAILLVGVDDEGLNVVGMLHPEPAIPLDYRTFRTVPFLRLEWPIPDDVIRTEWVMAEPRPSRDRHKRVTMTNAELKGQ